MTSRSAVGGIDDAQCTAGCSRGPFLSRGRDGQLMDGNVCAMKRIVQGEYYGAGGAAVSEAYTFRFGRECRIPRCIGRINGEGDQSGMSASSKTSLERRSLNVDDSHENPKGDYIDPLQLPQWGAEAMNCECSSLLTQRLTGSWKASNTLKWHGSDSTLDPNHSNLSAFVFDAPPTTETVNIATYETHGRWKHHILQQQRLENERVMQLQRQQLRDNEIGQTSPPTLQNRPLVQRRAATRIAPQIKASPTVWTPNTCTKRKAEKRPTQSAMSRPIRGHNAGGDQSVRMSEVEVQRLRYLLSRPTPLGQ